MLGLGTFSVLVVFGIIAFAIYFIFKQIQFFVLSVNLYRKMISQQDTIISLLRKGASPEMKKCPTCAEMIKIEAKKCHFCGELFSESDINAMVEQQKKLQESVKEAEYKLVKNQFGDAYCSACNRTSPMNGMYHHRATDTYYHKDCLPQMPQSPAIAQPTEQPATEPVDQPTALPTTLFCAQCGERLEPGITFCPNCGTKAGVIPAVS